ncbi:MAG: RagB/SusD family nutrient uptake outer membrane protein [Siphonobacter sp.]
MKYFVILLLFLSSCQGLLDKEPQNKISLEETFTDFESAKVALSGAYRSFLEISYYNGNRMLYPEVTGGNVKYSQISKTILLDTYFFAASADDGDMNNTYQQLYSILNNLNNIIYYVPSITNGTEKTRTRLVAEATALRALVHLDLVQLFAQHYGYTANASHEGIILNLEPVLLSESIRARSTVAECYQAILADLQQALVLFENSTAVFSDGSTKNYMSPAAVKGLMARVYLNMGNWQEAYQYADELIASNSYSLYTNAGYVTAWIQTNTSESIFELAVPTSFTGTSLGTYFDVSTVSASSTDLQMAATTDLLSLYSATDVRNQSHFYTSATVSNTEYWFCQKYPTGSANATPIKVIRLSEMYLIRAEAAAELGNLTQALADLNTIQQRADSTAVALSISDSQQLIDRILLERRKELCYEGFLLFDLARRQENVTRTDCSGSTCTLQYPSPYYVLPFPTLTVQVNPLLSQNPGY